MKLAGTVECGIKSPISESITLNKHKHRKRVEANFRIRFKNVPQPSGICFVCNCNFTDKIRTVKLILFRHTFIDFSKSMYLTYSWNNLIRFPVTTAAVYHEGEDVSVCPLPKQTEHIMRSTHIYNDQIMPWSHMDIQKIIHQGLIHNNQVCQFCIFTLCTETKWSYPVVMIKRRWVALLPFSWKRK